MPLSSSDPTTAMMLITSQEVAMRRISCALLFGIALISISACADIPGNPGAAPKASQTASCDWLEGYPGCHAPGTGTSGNATAVAQTPAP
jgi:hypothetical protein